MTDGPSPRRPHKAVSCQNHDTLSPTSAIARTLADTAPRHQGEGFGREIVTAWWPQFAAFPVLRRVRGEVWLKNWPALRFWVATGLRHIHLIRGDRRPEAGTHASVILEGALHDMTVPLPEAGTPTHRSEPGQR